MDGRGRLRVSTRRDGGFARLDVEDSGHLLWTLDLGHWTLDPRLQRNPSATIPP
jgi:hypothetical protein